MKTYTGERTYAPTLNDAGDLEFRKHMASGVIVRVHQGNTLQTLDERFHIRNHSPTGFNWGYGGSGPAQLALALCCDALGEQVGSDPIVYQVFKRDFVASWDDKWSITDHAILDWFNSLFKR